MEFKIVQKAGKKHLIYIVDSTATIGEIAELNASEQAYAKNAFTNEQQQISINQYSRFIFLFLLKNKNNDWQTFESCRKAGVELQAAINKLKLDEVTIINQAALPSAAYYMAEGMALANYQFLKYRTEAEKQKNTLQRIQFLKPALSSKELTQLGVYTDATYRTRTLVNEPPNYLTAVRLAKEIEAMGKDAGFKVTVLQKNQIEKEKMGGLLAVNRGSQDPPTFTIMEHKPTKAKNSKPIVLVGKGVVYDTGGLSLKPTPNSMDRMKSDMSGAALVSGAMYAIAKLQLPLHVIALVPATDNRPGETAYVPQDVITMHSGATVEVLNTDAEGRMILADALHWAKKYNPELVLDFATLTGAAATAIGEYGIVCMGTAEQTVKDALTESGQRQYERLVEYPLWDEYGELIKSDIADIKNVGGPAGGAITAGKFLQYFTAYPWMHFDIAGVSFTTAKRNYYTVGGTAYGLHMLLDFLTHYAEA